MEEEIEDVLPQEMQEKIFWTQMIIAGIAIVLGAFLHFLYQLSGENIVVAAFSSVNESVWEHLKLAFFPMLLLGVIEYFWVGKQVNNYLEAKTIGIFTAISFIVVFYYTYTGILGTNFLVIDILSFVIGIILGEWVAYKLFLREEESTRVSKTLSFAILGILLFSFLFATYYPPKVNFFKDSVTGGYGIQGKEF